MKLYIVSGSPNARKTQAVVNHLELDVEIINKDFMSGELKAEEYLAINPNGKVPALEVGEFKLWESNAIMQFLAAGAPENDLFPDDSKARIDIIRWQFWETAHYNRALGSIVWETVAKPVFKMPGEPDEDIIKSSIENFHTVAPVLENQLEGKQFITGNIVTIADFSVGALSAMVLSSISRIPLEKYPNIKSWYQRLEDVPAWAKAKPPFDL